MDKILYFDQDGVLACFKVGILEALGIDANIPYKRQKDYHLESWVDMLSFDAINEAAMGEDFWYNLDIVEDAKFMLDTAHRLMDKENIFILTSPWEENELCIHEKKDWLNENFPEYGHLANQFIPTKWKYHLAKQNKLLIDDMVKNTEHFIDHGGQALLYPQPWNQPFCDSFEELEEARQKFRNTFENRLKYFLAS